MERINGFVMAQDVVRGTPVVKIRITEPGHPLDRKKCRIASVHGEYVPKKNDNVSFVIGSTVEGGHKLLLAYDVMPAAVSEPRKRQELPASEEDEDIMNWFILQSEGRIYANCLGLNSVEEAQAELGENEKVLAFVPFDIREYLDRDDEPGAEEAFALVAALARTTPTLVALEKLVSALIEAAIKSTK